MHSGYLAGLLSHQGLPINIPSADYCRMRIWNGPTQDNQTRFITVSKHLPDQSTRSGVTLTELLVVMAVIAALLSLAVPTWGAITRSQANNAAISLAMGTLEQARLAALSGKKEVWVLFRNDEGLKQASLRIMTRASTGSPQFIPAGSWTMLPRGVMFLAGENTLMDQKPPAEVITTALGAAAGALMPPTMSLGGLMFQRSGRIGIPQQGGPMLFLRLRPLKGSSPASIGLSRGTGRASYNSK